MPEASDIPSFAFCFFLALIFALIGYLIRLAEERATRPRQAKPLKVRFSVDSHPFQEAVLKLSQETLQSIRAARARPRGIPPK